MFITNFLFCRLNSKTLSLNLWPKAVSNPVVLSHSIQLGDIGLTEKNVWLKACLE